MEIPRKETKYAFKDLVDFVTEFYQEHNRLPQKSDIVALSKLGRCPSMGTFSSRGGLGWVIEQAGFVPPNPLKSWDVFEVTQSFREFVHEFLKTNHHPPQLKDILKGAKMGTCPFPGAIKKWTGKTPFQIMQGIGVVRRVRVYR